MWLLLACAPVAEPDPVEFSSMPEVVHLTEASSSEPTDPVFGTTTTVSFDDPICSEIVPVSPVVPCALAPDPERIAACGSAAALLGDVAYRSVQDALDAAVAGDVIEVCPGTWARAEVGEDVVLAALDPTVGATVIEGAGASALRLAAAATVRGLTLRGGPVDGAAVDVLVPGAHLDCVTIDGNDGAAVIAAGEVTLTASTLRENHGGGVIGGPVVAEDTVFESNDSDSSGGALAVAAGSAVRRCWFAHNTASADGGALWWGGGALTVEDSVFHCNDAAGAGGALSGEALTLTRSTLSSNLAAIGGGIAATGEVHADEVRLEWNVAQASGGAMSLVGGVLTAVTVADNRAPHAAAVDATGAVVGEGLVVVRNLADDAAVTLSAGATLACGGCDFGLGVDDNRPTDAITDSASADQLGASFSL